jgi:hypothetical protein
MKTLLNDAVIGGAKWMNEWIAEQSARNRRLENLRTALHEKVSINAGKIFSTVRREMEIRVKEHNLKVNLIPITFTQDKGENSEIISIQLDFVKISNIRRILERDYIDIQKCMKTECWKSVLILCGGCIEGILYDLLKRKGQKAMNASNAHKGKSGAVKKLEDWDLSHLIDTALELKLIQQYIPKLSHTVREFRNIVHPCNEVRTKLPVESEGASIAFNFLVMLIKDLQEKHDKRRMSKLRGKLVISPDQPKVYIIDGKQKRHVAAAEYIPTHLRDRYEVCSQRLLDKFDNGAQIHSESTVIQTLQKYSKK